MSPSPDAPLALALYANGLLRCVLLEGGGPLYGAVVSAKPLGQHALVRGRFTVANGSRELVAALAAASSMEALREVVQQQGYEVRPTPVAAVRWALQDVPLP